ncbi:MAG: hypothetical protein GTO14_17885 [Anaerolineales bacterium]|nr:hypothetical protein [Anaerolineales bacterium]
MSQLEKLEIGGGRVATGPMSRLEMVIPPKERGYADAQLDDYRRLPRGRFPWRPPLRLELRARASHPTALGTLGFGFWNDPFTLSLGQGGAARRLPATPNALWFFYGSPPNDMALVPDVPGHGWKAASMRSPKIPSALLAPLALGAVLMAQLPVIRKPIMRTALRFIDAEESLLNVALDEWHQYLILWKKNEARFEVDGITVLSAQNPTPGPLGFVTWIDNQYAIASPQGGFRFGVLQTSQEQWLEIEALSIEVP